MSEQLFRNVLAEFSGTHSIISVQRSYIRFAGDLQGGVLLSQMIYWGSRKTNRDGWFYKTYAEWQEEVYLSEKTVRRYSDAFEKRGFLRSEVRRNSQNLNIRHYRINWEVLAEQMQNHFAETPAAEGTSTLGGLETAAETPAAEGTSTLGGLETDRSEGSGKSIVPVPLIYTSINTSTSSSKKPENFSEQDSEESKPSPVKETPIVETDRSTTPTIQEDPTPQSPPSRDSLSAQIMAVYERCKPEGWVTNPTRTSRLEADFMRVLRDLPDPSELIPRIEMALRFAREDFHLKQKTGSIDDLFRFGSLIEWSDKGRAKFGEPKPIVSEEELADRQDQADANLRMASIRKDARDTWVNTNYSANKSAGVMAWSRLAEDQKEQIVDRYIIRQDQANHARLERRVANI